MTYNKIQVAFGALRKITGPFISYQFDVQQILVINGLNLPEYYEVDFCNEGDTYTETIVGTVDGGVAIPNKFLRTGKKVKAYLVLVGDGDVQTRYEITLPVNVRPQRQDIDPTDDQQLQIDELVAALNSGVAKAEEAVEHYPKITDGYWYVWDGDAVEYVSTDIKAEGTDGTDGVSPTVTITDITGGHRITITDEDHPTGQSFDVMNGTDGDDGYSPAVTITTITGGHRITITDKDHPQGQTFDVLDGQGGGGTSDYTDLTNKPQINGHTLSGNQTAEQLGLATPSDIPTDAGDIEYDDSATYQSGTVGAELNDLNRQLSDLEDTISTTQIINTASGSIASFDDGADSMPIRKLVAQIEPVQDLHGQDSPYPAGGGKNKLNTAIFDDPTFIINSDGSITQTVNDGRAEAGMQTLTLPAGTYTYTTDVAAGKHSVYYNDGGWVFLVRDSTATSNTFTLDAQRDLYIKISMDASSYPVTLKVQIVEGSTALPWSPYSNICPISGHTGAEIYDDPAYGELINWNQLNNYTNNKTRTINGLTFTNNNDGSISVTGTCSLSAGYSLLDSGLTITNGHKLYISGVVSTANYSITNTNSVISPVGVDGMIITASSTSFLNIVNLYVVSGATLNIKVYPQIFDLTQMFGTTVADYIFSLEQTTAGAGVAWFRNLFPKDYYAYNTGEETTVSAVNGDEYNQISVTFPASAGTVYGGTLTINPDRTGTLVVDMAMMLVDGSITGADVGNVDVVRLALAIPINSFVWTDLSNTSGKLLSNVFKEITNDQSLQGNIGVMYRANGSHQIVICFGSTHGTGLVSTPDEARQWVADNPFYVCYALSELNVYTLTESEISGILTTLYGQNNVWADTGDVEVTYPADTKLYIDGKLAEIQATILENIGG